MREVLHYIPNNDRLSTNVLQVDSNSSDSSDYNSDDKNWNETLSVQSSINDNSSNDGIFFPLSIIDNDYHTQDIATDVIIDFEKYTNDSLQKRAC